METAMELSVGKRKGAIFAVLVAVSLSILMATVFPGYFSAQHVRQLPTSGRSGTLNSSVIVPKGTVTNVTSGGFVSYSFNISAPGHLSGLALPNVYAGFYEVLNDTNLSAFQANKSWGWYYEFDTPWGVPVSSPISFNLSLPAGGWHLVVMNPENPPGTGTGQRIPGLCINLYWTESLVVTTLGSVALT